MIAAFQQECQVRVAVAEFRGFDLASAESGCVEELAQRVEDDRGAVLEAAASAVLWTIGSVIGFGGTLHGVAVDRQKVRLGRAVRMRKGRSSFIVCT